MNPAKFNEYDYINFLTATPIAYSCTEAERVQPHKENAPAHDAITRLLHRLKPGANSLRDEALQLVDLKRVQFFLSKTFNYAALSNSIVSSVRTRTFSSFLNLSLQLL